MTARACAACGQGKAEHPRKARKKQRGRPRKELCVGCLIRETGDRLWDAARRLSRPTD